MNPIVADGEITDIMTRGFMSWESLSTVEKTRFTIMQARDILHVQNVMLLYKKGLLDSVDLEAWKAYGAACKYPVISRLDWRSNGQKSVS